MDFTNLEELDGRAKKILDPMIYGYYASGALSEETVTDNRDAFKRYRILPRILRDVSNTDTSCTLFGRRVGVPVIVAPMAMQRMAHPDGELAVARAAAAEGFGMGVSTMGTVGLADVADAGRQAPILVFQLYVITDRAFTLSLIRKAEAAGYHALAITVDAPVLGRREADERNGFRLPKGLRLVNLEPLGEAKTDQLGVYRSPQKEEGSGLSKTFAVQIDPSLTWDFMIWLRANTRLHILVKGLLAPSDAEKAVEAGVDGIIVSNHGGRQLDCAPATLDVLPAIVATVNRRVPVLVDGGIRRGTDIFKALALGADGVMVGRPVLYALALGGEAGVRRALAILKTELVSTMQLAGCPSLSDITRPMLIGPGDPLSRL